MSAPKFQHRHYAPLAELLHRHIVSYERNNAFGSAHVIKRMAEELETLFAMDNEHFDRARWRAAWRGEAYPKDKRTAAKAWPSASV